MLTSEVAAQPVAHYAQSVLAKALCELGMPMAQAHAAAAHNLVRCNRAIIAFGALIDGDHVSWAITVQGATSDKPIDKVRAARLLRLNFMLSMLRRCGFGLNDSGQVEFAMSTPALPLDSRLLAVEIAGCMNLWTQATGSVSAAEPAASQEVDPPTEEDAAALAKARRAFNGLIEQYMSNAIAPLAALSELFELPAEQAGKLMSSAELALEGVCLQLAFDEPARQWLVMAEVPGANRISTSPAAVRCPHLSLHFDLESGALHRS
jgi:hypothetical protein